MGAGRVRAHRERRARIDPAGAGGGPAGRVGSVRKSARGQPSQRFLEVVRISPVSEGELVEQARLGDPDAFGALVERHAPMVRRLTRAVLRHAADADDAAQDAFVAAWKSLGQFDPAQALAPWLARIALNAARDTLRRRRVRESEAIPAGIPTRDPGPEEDADRELLSQRLDAALAALPERQRLAVVLHDVEGYRHAEIAQLLEVPEGTVRSEVFHGRRRLRAALTMPGGEP